jgi:cytochrome c
MRKNMFFNIVMAVLFLGCSVYVANASTAEEAKANAENAAVFVKENGKEKAFAEFNNPNGQFTKGDLYIFAVDFNGVQLANGGNPKLVGMNTMEMKDQNGILLTKEMLNIVKTKGSGWVDYSWVNPATKKVQGKTTYVKRIEGNDYFVACGIWK